VTLLTELYPHIAIQRFCTVFGKSRQAWYYGCHQDQQQIMTDSLVVKMVMELRKQQPRLGTRKLYHLITPRLQEHNIKLGRDKLFEILERYGLLIRYRKRKAVTTNSHHHFYKYDNLIQQLTLRTKNQLWVSDITYISLRQGFAYLSLVTDAFSRKVVGYCLWPTLAAQGPMHALDMALEQINNTKVVEQLIHHSDRGIQYCCSEYVQRLNAYNIQISMSHRGDPYQNAIAERINGILKMEFGLNKVFDNIDKANEAVQNAVELYNNKRPHSSLNYLTPVQAHQLTGIIKRNWKNYKQACQPNQEQRLAL
jgi:putative transposase